MDVMAIRRKVIEAGKRDLFPPGYTQIEYLESTGTQYIDTLLTGNINREWIIEFSDFNRNGNSYAGPFGITSSGAYVQITCGAVKLVYTAFGNKADIVYGTSQNSYVEWGSPEKRKISISKNGVYENDVQKLSAYSNLTYGASDMTAVIFARKESNGNVGRIIKTKIYSFICKENGELVANMVPCIRGMDSKPGMYDTVRNAFFTNSGTGEFIVPA